MGYTDKEKAAAYAREWRAKHADQVREEDRERRARQRLENPSAATQKMREWRAANPEKAKAQAYIGNAVYKKRLKTDPEFRENERKRKEAYKADPQVKERNRKYNTEWHRVNRAAFPELVRKKSLKSNYGLTVEQYDAMVRVQEGKCAICRSDNPGNSRSKNWHIDHCHDTDRVRALLCHGCNTGLGAFKDDPELLRAAVAYLEKHSNPC